MSTSMETPLAKSPYPNSEVDGSTPEVSRPFDWFRTLGPKGKKAFVGSYAGFGLDSYDFQILPVSLVAISATFGLSSGQAGLLATATLASSALGGALAGILIDRIGRVRTMVYTVLTFALFTMLCGFAQSFEALLIFRTLQGIGFGGEWAAGAVLLAEYAQPRYRGRTLGFMQSSWAAGWALAVIAYAITFAFADPDIAWRILFWLGALPALLILWLRRNVEDSAEAVRARETAKQKPKFSAIFRGPIGRTTLFACLLTIGIQGGYFTLVSWVPSFLNKTRGLNVMHSSGYLTILISSAFVGYLTGGYLADLLGRRRMFLLFAVLSAGMLLVYTQIPPGANFVVLLLGIPLGFVTAAPFAGFGSFLAELYPTHLRGTGQGFTYNFGRGVGALFPATVGFLATTWGLGSAMAVGALAYVLAAVALLGLPETRGRELD